MTGLLADVRCTAVLDGVRLAVARISVGGVLAAR